MPIKWEEPPTTDGDNNWGSTVQELKANPGKWALVRENFLSTAAYAAGRHYGLEVKFVGIDAKGKASKVYARYPEDE